MKINPVNSIPNKSSSAAQWVEWYKVLKSNFGKKQARVTWLKAWRLQGNTWSQRSTDLIQFMGKQGVNVETNIIQDVAVGYDKTFDTIGDFLQVGKYTVFAVLGITVVGLGMVVYNVAKNPIKSAKAIGDVVPAGRALKASKALK